MRSMVQRLRRWLLPAIVCLGAIGCSGGGGGGGSDAASPQAPTLSTQPQDVSVVTGESASFSVTSSGDAPLTYQWRRNGTPIGGATAATYTLTAARGDDGAEFSVVVANSAGSATSRAARLTVTDPPAAITTAPQSVGTTVGQTATFSVVASGTGTLSYQWMRDGADIAGATAASYTTAALSLADNGAKFSVRVTDANASTATSAAAMLTVTASGLPSAATNRYLTPISPLVLEGYVNARPGERYVVDPLQPAATAALSPVPSGSTLARGILGSQVDQSNALLRQFGVRHLIYNVGASDLYRLPLDRSSALPATSISVAPGLATCEMGHRYLGSSKSGDSVLYVLLGDRPRCVGGTYYVVNVGPAGDGKRVALPGMPIDITYDNQGNIDGYLTWTESGGLAYVDPHSGSVASVDADSGAPEYNGGVFTTTGTGRNSIPTRNGILFRDGFGFVWRFDKATKTVTGPLWKQLSGLAAPVSRVSVEADAVIVGDIELLPGSSGPASSVSGEPTLWRVDDSRAATVTTLAKGGELDLNSVRFSKDYVLFTDRRATHVAVSRRDGSLRWTGSNQVGGNAVETIKASLLSNRIFFAGTPVGGTPRIVSVDLDSKTTPDPLNLELAGSAISDTVPLHTWYAYESHGLPLSHLLAWRRAPGRSDLSGAELVWVDMASAAVGSSSGTLPAYAYTSSTVGLVTGHIGIGWASSLVTGTDVPNTAFTFSIAGGSLKVFTPPK